MADLNDTQGNVTVVSRPHWGAIWAGMFTFVAIWSVFITLGAGIFATSASSAPGGDGPHGDGRIEPGHGRLVDHPDSHRDVCCRSSHGSISGHYKLA